MSVENCKGCALVANPYPFAKLRFKEKKCAKSDYAVTSDTVINASYPVGVSIEFSLQMYNN